MAKDMICHTSCALSNHSRLLDSASCCVSHLPCFRIHKRNTLRQFGHITSGYQGLLVVAASSSGVGHWRPRNSILFVPWPGVASILLLSKYLWCISWWVLGLPVTSCWRNAPAVSSNLLELMKIGGKRETDEEMEPNHDVVFVRTLCQSL